MKYIEYLKEKENVLKSYSLDIFCAKLLLSELLNTTPSSLISYYDKEVDEEIRNKFESINERYIDGTPLEYLIHKAYFYGNEFYVDENVLIPRNDTEILVETFLNNNKDEKLTILDLCCGSGCIGLTVKKQRPNYTVMLSDISEKCIEITKENAKRLNVDCEYFIGDLLEPINKPFDILLCNPPYIALDDENVDKMALKEPHLALFTSDKDGVEIYIKLFEKLNNMNFKKAYFEFGFKQKSILKLILEKYNFKYHFYKDYGGNDRVLEIIKI